MTCVVCQQCVIKRSIINEGKDNNKGRRSSAAAYISLSSFSPTNADPARGKIQVASNSDQSAGSRFDSAKTRNRLHALVTSQSLQYVMSGEGPVDDANGGLQDC